MKSYDKVPPIKKQKLHRIKSSSTNFLTFLPLENLESRFHSWCMSLSCGRMQKPETIHRGTGTQWPPSATRFTPGPASCEGPVLTTAALTR